MSPVERQVSEARRRLTQNIFFERLCRGVLVAAGLWSLAILIVRLFALGVPLVHGSLIAAGIALLIAVTGTLLRRPSPLRAAVALDTAAGLKERLSTALVVAQSADPFARAAVQDAEQTAGRIHVPSHIRHRAPGLWPWSTAVTGAALLLFWLMPQMNLFAHEPATPGPDLQQMAAKERQAIATEVSEQLNKIKTLAQQNPALKQVAEDIQPLTLPEGPGITPEDLRREAIKRVDEVGDKLKRELERTDVNPAAELKRMLTQLETRAGEQAESKLTAALTSGDFESAKQSLQKMANELKEAAAKSTDPQAAQKLEEMQQQLEKLAAQLNKLDNSVQIQKELENKAGLSAEEAKKLAEKLANTDPKQLQKELQKVLGNKATQQQLQQLVKKIQQNQQAKKAAQSLAKSLSKAAQACKQCQGQSPGSSAGTGQDGAQALSEAAEQLSDMEMAEQMMNELSAQLSDLQKLRDDIGEGNCQGPGDGDFNDEIGNQGPQYGRGLGSRIGKETTPYKSDPTKAETRYQSGQIIGQYLIDGPQVKGQVSKDVVNAALAAISDAQDAVERSEIPRQYEKVAKEYFERLTGVLRDRAGGKPTEKPAPAEKTEDGA